MPGLAPSDTRPNARLEFFDMFSRAALDKGPVPVIGLRQYDRSLPAPGARGPRAGGRGGERTVPLGPGVPSWGPCTGARVLLSVRPTQRAGGGSGRISGWVPNSPPPPGVG